MPNIPKRRLAPASGERRPFPSRWWMGAAAILLAIIALAAIMVAQQGDESWEDAGSNTAVVAAASVQMAATPELPRDFTFTLPLFRADSAWNQAAVDAPVLPESDRQVLATYRMLRGDASKLVPPGQADWFPVLWVNHDEYSMPIFRAGAGEQSVTICDYDGRKSWPSPKFGVDQLGGPVTVPALAGPVQPAMPRSRDSDGHLILYQSTTFTTFDFWQATTKRVFSCNSLGGGRTGTAIQEAGAIDFFDVRGDGGNMDGESSARATGPPLLAGLILPEDVESGAIAHALAFAIPGPRNLSSDPSEPLTTDYFYPASTTETDFYSTDPDALAAGQRIRLKQSLVDESGASIDETQLAPITRMFLAALRTYGAYLVDGAGGFAFYAEETSTADLHLSADQVNTLIGKAPGTLLPSGKTQWQIVMDALNEELGPIPFAYGPWPNGQDPATAPITTANFEVVEPAARPAPGTVTPTPTVTVTPTATTTPPAQAGHILTPPAGKLYHGIFPGGTTSWGEEDDITLADLQSYEQSVGKRAAWVYFSHNWFRERRFPVTTTTWIKDAGSVPFIRLMLRNDALENHAEPTFTLDRIIQGDFDADLKAWARAARDFGSPLLAEYGTEVNGEWFPWNGKWNGGGVTDQYGDPSFPDGPERFRDAYRRIIQIARQEGATNLTWVFHVDGEDAPDSAWNRMENYYPGDSWIDWLGVSVYGALTPMESECAAFRSGMDAIYPRLAALSATKPIVVLEFGVAANNPRCAQEQWARGALSDLTAGRWPRVVGFSWWNEMWENDDTPSHNTTIRVQDNPALAAVFQELVGQNAAVLGRIAAPGEPTTHTVHLPAVRRGADERAWWRPPVTTTWQWQLDAPIDTAVEAQVYDIDLFDNDAAAVTALHSQGRKVICYISAGSWEEWRPDAGQFPAAVLGKDYDGWPGEKWLDIRQIDLLAPILRARLDRCRDKGFDGVEPDNIDGYSNDTGFPLAAQDQIVFNTWLAGEAHARGLSIGIKNDGDQATDMLAYFDWALTEDCFADKWCEQMKPFITAGKAVFAAEYTDTGMTLGKFCAQAQALQFNAILKHRDLDAWRQACPSP